MFRVGVPCTGTACSLDEFPRVGPLLPRHLRGVAYRSSTDLRFQEGADFAIVHHRLMQDGSMRKLLGFAALLAAVAACDSNSPTALPPQLSNVIQSTTLLNVDDAFSAVAEVLPSFGGLSYDAAGNIQVFMRPPYDEAQTVAVLTEFLTERSSPYESKSFQWRFVTAQYTWPELLAIRRAVSPLTVTSGFVYLDADESNNRVTIAVSNAEAERYIRSAITVSGIDERAIGFIRLGPMVPMTTLRERIRPIPAGFVTGWQYPGISSECTHGFNVRRAPDDGYIYFLMNDHCSGARATVDGTTYYQPYTGPLQDVIGTEVVDPGYFDNNSDPACEVGFVCRYSDANLVRYSVSASGFGDLLPGN